jgi:thiaminase
LPSGIRADRSRYVLDIGQSDDWFALQIALAPCLLVYSIIAKRLYSDPQTKRDGNVYWKWILSYVADDYSEAVRVGSSKSNLLSALVRNLTMAKI